MKKKNTRILKADFEKIHPDFLKSESDAYYVKIANNVFKVLEIYIDDTISDNELRKTIAIALAGYFEDIVSQLGLWEGYAKINKHLFKRTLPFINCAAKGSQHVLTEINPEDIQIIIWLYLQRNMIDNKDGRFLNPDNIRLIEVAYEVYSVFYDDFENALVNNMLYNLIHLVDLSDEYFLYREVLEWLHYNSYLSMSYPLIECQKEQDDIRKNSKSDVQDLDVVLYHSKVNCIFANNCAPNAIKVYHWLAKISTNQGIIELSEGIQHRPLQFYEILAVDKQTIKFRGLHDNSKVLIVNLNSFDFPDDLTNKYIHCSLVYFNNLWQINGMVTLHKQIKIEKEKIPLDDLYALFLKASNNKSILYFKNMGELNKFFKKLNKNNNVFFEELKDATNIVVFAHPSEGVRIFPDIAGAIKDVNNPYYDKVVAKQNGITIVMGSQACPRELIDYLLSNNLLADATINSFKGPEYGHKLAQENLKFIYRFYQPEHFRKQNALINATVH